MAIVSKDLVDPHKKIKSADELVEIFQLACTSRKDYAVGVELECFAVDPRSFRVVPFFGEHSISALFIVLQQQFAWQPVMEAEQVIGLSRGDEHIALEPGGVVEYASKPDRSLWQLEQDVKRVYQELLQAGRAIGIDFLFSGYAPNDTVESVQLVPKERYHFMYDLMAKVGSKGREMMKLTAAIQVSIDYRSEADAIEKFILASKCTPFFIAMCANSSVRNNQFNQKACYRSEVWCNTDDARCGFPDFIFNAHARFQDFVDWALQVPMYYVERVFGDDDKIKKIFLSDYRFQDFLDGKVELPGGVQQPFATFGDWEAHIMNLFPWVRFRHYVEIRAFDMVKPKYQMAVAALIKGLFYDKNARQAVDDLVGSLNQAELNACMIAVERNGLEAECRGQSVRDYCLALLDIAREGLVRQDMQEEHYLESLRVRVREWQLSEVAKEIRMDLDGYLRENLLSSKS